MKAKFLDTCWNEVHRIIDEAMAKRDRTVTIYISPDGGMSVNLSPWPEPAESSDDTKSLDESRESELVAETPKDEWPSTVDEFCNALEEWDRITQRIKNGEIPLSYDIPFDKE